MARSPTAAPPVAPSSRGRRLRAHLELADPITWIAPAGMVLCGALAAGRGAPGFQIGAAGDLLRVGLAALMCGPLATGFSQSINDYFDRDLDAINDPARPIPSGQISLAAARANWVGLALGALAIALYLTRYSPWVPLLALSGLFLAAAYSIPPLKLKQRYWLGAPAVGIGYVLVTWLIGHLIFAPLTWPSVAMALINSATATGMIFLNDIKSVEGDRRLGLKSLTVALGVEQTLVVAFAIMGGCNLILLGLALWGGYLWAAGLAAVALIAPIPSQIRLFREPNRRNFVRYLLISNPFVLLIQFISALIVGGYLG